MQMIEVYHQGQSHGIEVLFLVLFSSVYLRVRIILSKFCRHGNIIPLFTTKQLSSNLITLVLNNTISEQRTI